MPSASFYFGPNIRHKVSIECGLFGSEKYFVDGTLMLSLWSLGLGGLREFTFNGYKVQIRIRVGMTAVYGEAFVDGECVASDLFAEFNAKLPSLHFNSNPSSDPNKKDGMSLVSKFGIWLALVLAVLVALKYFG